MDTSTVITGAIGALCCIAVWALLNWKSTRRNTRDAKPTRDSLALRNRAAFALATYWSHYYDGWSLVLFRDDSGAVRHVACGVPDGTFFDASGYVNAEQIGQRLGAKVTAEESDEAEVQSLADSTTAVLEAAEDLRHSVEHKSA